MPFSTTRVGTQNTASGAEALLMNTSGLNNTANGWRILRSGTTLPAARIHASGANALPNQHGPARKTRCVPAAGAHCANGTGDCSNTANGVQALFANHYRRPTTRRTVMVRSLKQYTRQLQHSRRGVQALFSNTVGFQRTTATGRFALFSNTSGGSGIRPSVLRRSLTTNDRWQPTQPRAQTHFPRQHNRCITPTPRQMDCPLWALMQHHRQ